MMRGVAEAVRSLDPRLKMGVALALGPGLWVLAPPLVALLALLLLGVVVALSAAQPLGRKMVRSLFVFTAAWVAVKVVLDAVSGLPLVDIALGGGELALRLVSLLLLGISLAFSTSPRSLGLAVSWALRPFIGGERAWKVALSLALMVHFLPICLETMVQVRSTLERRCPKRTLKDRLTIVPQAILRNLGQKTWNQTLAVAGRGLESGDAWQPDFAWSHRDSAGLFVCVCIALILTI